MLALIKRLFGSGPEVDYTQLIKEGAVVIDVRSSAEFKEGHVPGALNIPLAAITSSFIKVRNKKTVIITCCASGMRSATAKNILKAAGYENVINAGSWMALNSKL